MHYAHSSASTAKQDWHLLAEHLIGTGERARSFLFALGHGDWGETVGRLHDLGKYSDEFQGRLEGGPPTNHSTAGAQEAMSRYGEKLGRMLAYCIAGHHAGLANGALHGRKTVLNDRISECLPAPDPVWRKEIDLPDLAPPVLRARGREQAGFCAAFFVRMLFSALVDADYLDTEAYFAKIEGLPHRRSGGPGIAELAERLEAHLTSLRTRAAPGRLNALRGEVLDHAISKAGRPKGVFSLTVPTGGGKTLTSLAFALDHAVRHGCSRVIYVIPYMNIVEQTAAVFRNALADGGGDADFIVEHHSNFDEGNVGGREAKEKLFLAMENWDAPIIVTTAVQFFESLFANRPSRCRKLHNIANSVVVLDEAQTLPLGLLKPCVSALEELTRNWGATVVLCTATQPALAESDGFSGGFEHVEELAPEPSRLYRELKRTRIVSVGVLSDSALAEQLVGTHQALCIVNTRRHARELYEALGSVEGRRHLSTLMCAHHRSEVLQDVRGCLQAGAPVRLISTSLVEAGVDMDFPAVWRAEAGLESIIQAAGRCNREGRAGVADVYVFRPEDANGRRSPAEIRQFADVARGVMRRFDDPSTLDAIKSYFTELYWDVRGEDALDARDILRSFREGLSTLDFNFDSVARDFRLIETLSRPVIVPYTGKSGNAPSPSEILHTLDEGARPGRVARRLQPHVVQVPPFVLTGLLAAGAVAVFGEERYGDQFVLLTNEDLYDRRMGLCWDDPTFRDAEGLMY